MITKPRKAKPAPSVPSAPIDWLRADPAELATFDPASKVCTMNCGPASGDPRDPRGRAERLLLCDDCEVVAPASNGNTPCKHCGSQDQSWQTHNVTRSGVQNGRLRLSEVECQFVLGCNHCSETLAVLSADRVAGMMNAALD